MKKNIMRIKKRRSRFEIFLDENWILSK